MFSGFAGDLGARSRRREAGGRKLYGFAEHTLTTTFLGTSTGLRLRHDQPTGKVDLNAKSADLARSAWAGCATRDFTDVDVAALDAGLQQRLDWARRKIDLPAGRYETLLPPGGRGRPARLPVLVGGGQGRAGRAERVQQAGRRHPGG